MWCGTSDAVYVRAASHEVRMSHVHIDTRMEMGDSRG